MKREKPLILVVDDEAHILHVISLKLANAGCEVITAEDGEAGLALAVDRCPDLVITDYQMPFLTGLELAEQLKRHERTRDTPVLVLTAHGCRPNDESESGTNIVGVLTKPFSAREILAKVRDLVGPRPGMVTDGMT